VNPESSGKLFFDHLLFSSANPAGCLFARRFDNVEREYKEGRKAAIAAWIKSLGGSHTGVI